MFDHPVRGSIVPFRITPEPWYIDLELGFAHTSSRFYRLGNPAKAIPDNVD